MKKINHPNVLSLIEVLPNKPEEEIIDLILPYCENGI